MATFKMRRGNVPKPNAVKPETEFSLPGVSRNPDGNFDVDWQLLGLLRKLNEDELLALRIYAQYRDVHGRFPKSELKHSMIRKASLEIRPERPINRSLVDEYLFVDLFPYNPDINFTTAVRRLLSDSRGLLEREESEQALIYLCEIMNKDNDADIRIIPNTGDVDSAVRAGLFIPGLATLMPTSSALLHSLAPGSWAEICQRVLGATKVELGAHHAMRRELDDLVEDYKKVFADKFPEFDGVEPAYVYYKDIEAYREKGGLGALRYKDVFARERKAGNNAINLNTIRELAGLPTDPNLDLRNSRPKGALKLDSAHICVGYLAAWRHKGLHLDPPSRDELEILVAKQTELLKQGLFKEQQATPKTRNGKTITGKPKVGMIKSIDAEAARIAGVPTTLVPSHSLICRHYDNMADLLGKIERSQGIKVEIEDNMRNSRMATEVIKSLRRKNDGQLPDGTVIQKYLARIPECVADHVRSRPAIAQILEPATRGL